MTTKYSKKISAFNILLAMQLAASDQLTVPWRSREVKFITVVRDKLNNGGRGLKRSVMRID